MNGTWRQIQSECIQIKMPEINKVFKICADLAERARVAEVDGMEEDDINEILMANEEDLDNESLISIDVEHALEEQIRTPDNKA